MLLRLCKSCQYCLESIYWTCCEEKFCFDQKIATYKLEEDTIYTNGYANMGASFDSVVTQQPINNNHLPPREALGREINELPLHADKLYEVFSKSLIFRDDHELKAKSSTDTLEEYETKSEPDLSDKPNRTKVYFEDEVNSPVTDFEIMFKDELLANHDMFKIEEEAEIVESQDTEEGCLESIYWTCCEEKFCFDQKIATYKLEEDTIYTNGYANMGASFDSVVTQQPINNNHLPPREALGREINELPLHADKLYEVFSKSLIFRDDHELKAKSSTDTLEEYETKSEPDLSDKPNRTKVYFEDEVNSPVTDFEIMFKDELLANHDMFKIEEEAEIVESQDTEEGLVMNVNIKKQDVFKPTTVTLKDETKITTQNPVYKYDPGSSMTLPSLLSLPRTENVKGILRQKGDLNRSQSSKTLERIESSSKLIKPSIKRVDSLKSIDPDKINKVLLRVPHRSASYLNIPEHLVPEKPPLTKSKSLVGVILSDSDTKLSSLPDTPIIRSNNLPRFFADSPTLLEYKEETSLQTLKQQSAMMMKEDFSMPRYYGTVPKVAESLAESKSMPDLTNPTSTVKVSKRLVKMRSKLKPLVLKKSSDERL